MKRNVLLPVFLTLVGVSAVVAVTSAGELNPPASAAPGGVPAPTMKTLDQIPPSWDQTLSAVGPLLADGVTRDYCNSPRFKCVMANRRAVLDKETGLVWQALAGTSGLVDWISAFDGCARATTGNRAGWRLPALEELLSLVGSGSDGLPTGHPFSAMVSVVLFTETFWTSSYLPVDNSRAAAFNFSASGMDGLSYAPRGSFLYTWCVRGGSRRIE